MCVHLTGSNIPTHSTRDKDKDCGGSPETLKPGCAVGCAPMGMGLGLGGGKASSGTLHEQAVREISQQTVLVEFMISNADLLFSDNLILTRNPAASALAVPSASDGDCMLTFTTPLLLGSCLLSAAFSFDANSLVVSSAASFGFLFWTPTSQRCTLQRRTYRFYARTLCGFYVDF